MLCRRLTQGVSLPPGSGTLNINITRKLIEMLKRAGEKWEVLEEGEEFAPSNSRTVRKRALL